MKAIVILSGGMDSTVMLYHLKQTYECFAVSFDYGQRHRKELIFARVTCAKLNIPHKVVDLSSITQLLGGSALTDNIEVPEGHYADENMKSTVVPNRNMIMLSLAVGYAVSIGAENVAYAAHSGDHQIYPDCRLEFVQKLTEVTKIANYQPVWILAPFIHMNKGQIAKLGVELGVDFALTWTCYKGLRRPCGKCGACRERQEAFQFAGVPDPGENND